MSSNPLFTRKFPVLMISITIFIMIASYYFPILGLEGVADMLVQWTSVIGAVAIMMGAISLTSYHLKQAGQRTRSEWPFSVELLGLAAITIILALIYNRKAEYTSWIVATMSSASASLNAMQAPYIFSAAYRSWKL